MLKEWWKKVRLWDICKTNMKSISKSYTHKNIRYIDISSVWTWVFHWFTDYEVNKAPSRARRLLSDWDTILSTVRPNRRSYFYIQEPKGNRIASTWFCVISPNSNIDNRFIYHLVTTQYFTDYLTNNAKWSAYPAVDTKTIERYEFSLPPLTTQQRIASILSNYDDLIENNTRRIQILEEQAQALYRQWFVEYKFPWYEKVELVDSGTDFGDVPEGWEVRKIWDAFDVIGGWTPSKKKSEYWWWKISWFTPSDITKGKSRFMAKGKDSITDLWLQKWSAKLFPAYCVMMTSRATIWAIAINTKIASVNQWFIVCVPTQDISYRYIYLWLQTMVDYILTISSGATFKELSKVVFRKELTLVPASNLLADFDTLVKHLFGEIENLEMMNINLKKQRDTLLPRLVSGEILVD